MQKAKKNAAEGWRLLLLAFGETILLLLVFSWLIYYVFQELQR